MNKLKIILPAIAGGLLLITLTVSIVLFKVDENKWHPYVMFFPKFTNPEEVDGEIRKIRLQDEDAENIERFVAELALGPADLRYLRIIPRGTKVNSVMYREGRLFIDFSYGLLFSEERNPLTLGERFELFTRSLRENFPDLGEIVYTVNGEVPFDFMPSPADN